MTLNELSYERTSKHIFHYPSMTCDTKMIVKHDEDKLKIKINETFGIGSFKNYKTTKFAGDNICSFALEKNSGMNFLLFYFSYVLILLLTLCCFFTYNYFDWTHGIYAMLLVSLETIFAHLIFLYKINKRHFRICLKNGREFKICTNYMRNIEELVLYSIK